MKHEKLKRILFRVFQWIWGFPQNLAGLVVFLFNLRSCRCNFRNALLIEWNHERGLSLGMYIFAGRTGGERMRRHEYGHSIQSLILGPFYLIFIGIPSVIWCCLPAAGRSWRTGMRSYYAFFPESWADRLGGVYELYLCKRT